MHFKVVESLWSFGQKKLCTEKGFDLIGSLLADQIDLTPGPETLPSQLKKLLPPFTIKCRNRVIDSPLTIQLTLLDFATSKEVVKTNVKDLLAKEGHTIEFL